MNVEMGAEAALFPEKEYMSGIFVAVLPISKTQAMLYNENLRLVQNAIKRQSSKIYLSS
jgi:hypothetical protein